MTTEMERAFYASDPSWDGRFVAAVRTTGIFCRPSCRVRKPLPRNVEYLADASVARAAGYRPCLRCQPEVSTPVTLRDVETPIGRLTIGATDRAVVLCDFSERPMMPSQLASVRRRIGPTADGDAPLLDRVEDAAAASTSPARRDDVRPADRHPRQRLPGAGLGRAAADPVRRDDQLPRARRARRRRRRIARRRPRQRLEPAGGHRALPPRGRGRRRARRLRRWARRETLAARPRGGPVGRGVA